MRWRQAERALGTLIKGLAAMACTIAAGTAYGWLLVQIGRLIL